MRSLVFPALLVSSLPIAACGPRVDCEALCARTLACEVTFQPPDDPSERKVQSGERSELESCTLGCEAHPAVTVDNARCIDELEVGDASVCQDQVLACLELSPAK